MKLLAVSLPRHDTNFTYFDGVELKYVKLERVKQIKRYNIENKWEWIYQIKDIFNVDVSEIDHIILDFHVESYYTSIPKEIQDVINGKTNAVKLHDDINPFKEYFNHPSIWYISHHYAHSLSTWMIEDNKPDVAIVIDGVGDHRTWSVFRNDTLLDHGRLENGSIGGEMIRAGVYLGVKYDDLNDIAGKVMGLQSYGNMDESYLDELRQYNIKNIFDIFSKDKWMQYKKDELIAKLSPLDWIKTVHHRMGEVLIEFFKDYAKEDETISYSGGVAQNVIWNTEIKKVFKNTIIPPHSGDEGLSLGAIEWLRKNNNLPKFALNNFPYSQTDLASEPVNYETIKHAAKMLAEGKTVGWYQGNGEIGPRALGNRSILMDPRIKNGRQIINNIKNRENYRPFGASALKEYVNDYFDLQHDDHFMLYTTNVLTDDLEAITHVDKTCRLQTVDKSCGDFRTLLEEFYKLTGCPILLNTSLNTAGKPLAAFPENAKDLFFNSFLDALVVGNKILKK
jgi:carbamoyltransferase